ncbi:MAG: hypothetical protein IKP20_00995 [Candidatus Methanomethylophilaceae archaeon]|nr:hypothetical protein [Candidatus Methanomethylophilaceae archaeon]
MRRNGSVSSHGPTDQILKWVFEGEFFPWKDFLQAYDAGAFQKKMPGCYIILTYSGNRAPRNLSKYHAGYVGQSTDVISRLHYHLTGYGNRKVYDHIRSGKAAVIQAIPCSAGSLNDMECALIYAFGRDRLFNLTDGGATHRTEDRSAFVFADRRLYPKRFTDNLSMRRIVLRADGKRAVSYFVDGIRLCDVSPNSPICIDLPEGKHSIAAKRLGFFSGRKTSLITGEIIVTANARRLRIPMTIVRRPLSDRYGDVASGNRVSKDLTEIPGEN